MKIKDTSIKPSPSYETKFSSIALNDAVLELSKQILSGLISKEDGATKRPFNEQSALQVAKAAFGLPETEHTTYMQQALLALAAFGQFTVQAEYAIDANASARYVYELLDHDENKHFFGPDQRTGIRDAILLAAGIEVEKVDEDTQVVADLLKIANQTVFGNNPVALAA